MKKTMNKLSAIVLGSLLSCGLSVSAQQDSLEMDVVFTGDLVLFLKDANKLSNWPEVKESVVEMPAISYTLIPNKQNVIIALNPIDPAKVNVEEKLTKLYRGFVKGGFGVYTTPLLEGYYTDGRSRNGTWGIHAKHLSSAGGVAVADSIPDRFSTNEIHLWGRQFLKKHALQGGLDYNRELTNAYGFDPEFYPETDLDNLELRYNDVGAFVQLTSYHRDSSKVNYDGKLSFFNFRDIDDGSENNIDFQAHARKFMNTELFSADFRFNYDQWQYFTMADSTEESRENALISLTPKASTVHENWKVTVGMGLVLDARGDKPFHFYPMAEAQYSLLDDLFIPYAGVTGQVKQNLYKTVANENPFIYRDADLKNTNEKLQLFGGIRGTISSAASFNARVSHTTYEDFLYFVNDTVYSSGNRFTPIYDDLSVLNLTGEVSIHTKDKLKLYMRGDYFIYGTGEEAKPWNQPNTKLTITGSYDLQDKLVIRADIFTEGRRKAKSLAPVQGLDPEEQGYYLVNLKGYLDANLGVEYRYTKRLSAWVQFNNFLAAKYARWNPYNVQRFNAMMGVSYAF